MSMLLNAARDHKWIANSPRNTVCATTPPRSSLLFQRVCRPAAIAVALVITVAWTVFLGYGLVRPVALAL